MPEVHRDPHAAIALMLQGFDLAQPDPDGQTRILADGRLGLRGASGSRLFQGTLNDRFQVSLGEANRIG